MMNSKMILVLDPNVQRRSQICHTLLLSGYEIIEAINAQHVEAICRQKGSEVDLIIAEAESKSPSEWKHVCPHAELLHLPIRSGPSTAEQLLSQVRLALDSQIRTRKVLIVDDDQPSRTEIAALLAANGYAVSATTGSEALAHFVEIQPDIVVTEIVMAGQEGLELIRKLRQLRQDLAIVAVTGGVRACSYLKAARLLGANAALTKPFPADELLNALVRSASDLAHNSPISPGAHRAR